MRLSELPRHHLYWTVLLLWLAFIGVSMWQHAQRTEQPPIHDAFTYFQKAYNFWAGVNSGKNVDPFNVEPTFRPPGTVVMSYPFGFDADFRGFYFRSIFLPIVLLAAGVVVAGYSRDLSTTSKWYLALVTGFLVTLPFFYYFEVSPDFVAPSHWGLVDNFLGGMAALAVAAAIRSIGQRSSAWLCVAALLSSFCLLIKPSGAFVMALIGVIWFGLALIRLKSAWHLREERRRTVRWLVQGLIILAVVDAVVLAVTLSSPYLSQQNLAFGNAAIVIMQTELQVTWPILQGMVHTGLGYAFIAWALLTALLVGWKLWRMPAGPSPWNKPMLCGLAFASLLTFAFGIWFWIFGSGGVYQIRYFVPFALMAMILAVPVMVRLIPAMHRWEVIVLSVPMALSVVNMGMLLAQSDPSIEWQKWAGVNLSSGGQDAVAVQAQNFLGTIKREGHDTILYSMPMSATDSKFQAVIDYSRTVGPSTPIVSIRRPVDWQRPTTYRISEMLGAEYWLFEPVRDPRVAKATLATRSIEGFYQERVLFQAWATQLTASDGVAVVSETPTARVLRITDSKRLESAVDTLIESHRWRKAFTSANPARRWSENSLADALLSDPPILENVNFGNQIELRALSANRTANEMTVRIWWRPLPGLKERGWIFFIHAIDDQGNIVVNKQISFDIQDQASPDETIRFNTISFATAPREAARRLAVGFYRPGLGQLRADKGVRDWNGGRVIVPAP
jgi:hypothetical protein